MSFGTKSWVPFKDPVYDKVGNILMSRLMGAKTELVDEDLILEFEKVGK